jgi:hypothetical protein
MSSIIYKASPVGELLDADTAAGIIKGYGSYFGNMDSGSRCNHQRRVH